jgi:hypothetical protein
VRQRKECPACGKGVFMAKHMDRHYCGKCHMTLRLDPATVKAAQEAYKKKMAEKKQPKLPQLPPPQKPKREKTLKRERKNEKIII